MLGRECPEMAADLIFTEDELLIMTLIAKKKKCECKTINEAIKIIALLGGYQGRKCDKHPGFQIIWNGLEKLYSMVFTIELFKENKWLSKKEIKEYLYTMKQQ